MLKHVLICYVRCTDEVTLVSKNLVLTINFIARVCGHKCLVEEEAKNLDIYPSEMVYVVIKLKLFNGNDVYCRTKNIHR